MLLWQADTLKMGSNYTLGEQTDSIVLSNDLCESTDVLSIPLQSRCRFDFIFQHFP
jgi:hypothetical protein